MSETKPPEENGSWLRWAVGQIGITDLIITEASPEPLTGLQVMDACIKELKEHEATAAAHQEAMRLLLDFADGWPNSRPLGAGAFIAAEIAAGRFVP